MDLLLDTHVLLWAAASPERLTPDSQSLINNPEHRLFFSAVSIWEVAIKQGLGRADFVADASVLRRALLAHDYVELPITSRHAALVASLPPVHKDPFDRMLVAQAITEGLVLLTHDATIAQYEGVEVRT